MNYAILNGGKLDPLRLLLPQNSKQEESPNLSRSTLLDWQPFLILLMLLAIWFYTSWWLQHNDPAAAVMSQSIWLLIILSFIAFLIILALCFWLLHLFWLKAALPPLFTMVSQFKTLATWQQLSFYLALYALLLLVASACLIGIC